MADPVDYMVQTNSPFGHRSYCFSKLNSYVESHLLLSYDPKLYCTIKPWAGTCSLNDVCMTQHVTTRKWVGFQQEVGVVSQICNFRATLCRILDLPLNSIAFKIGCHGNITSLYNNMYFHFVLQSVREQHKTTMQR